MDAPPSNPSQAVEILLTRCPELEPAWHDLCAWMEESTGDSVGIYNVFGQIVLPLLRYLLDESPLVEPDPATRGTFQATADPRLEFLEEAQWAALPRPSTPELGDLLARLYEVLDLWAATRDAVLQDAVYIELVEEGYNGLTVEDLLRHAGPNLRALADGPQPAP